MLTLQITGCSLVYHRQCFIITSICTIFSDNRVKFIGSTINKKKCPNQFEILIRLMARDEIMSLNLIMILYLYSFSCHEAKTCRKSTIETKFNCILRRLYENINTGRQKGSSDELRFCQLDVGLVKLFINRPAFSVVGILFFFFFFFSFLFFFFFF